MTLQLIQLLYTYLASTVWKSKSVIDNKHDEDPKTLLGLLQRAARLWPNHGIAFKDHGWDQKSDFMTYKDLLREAQVTIYHCQMKGIHTDKIKVQCSQTPNSRHGHAA
jgi:hypothetical protein